MHGVFAELSIVIIITAVVSLVMKLLRQPLILGYILAGLLVGPSVLGLIHSTEMFEAFSEIGIALLLFIIGLGMNVRELRRLGKVVLTIAISLFFIVTMVGYATSSVLGFSKTEAMIIGLSLFFSSTIIIVKILSDKKEQNRLHGQVAIGVILLDDIIATFALLFVAATKDGGLETAQIGLLVIKGVALLATLAICSTQILPRVSRYIASSQELLFLFAIAWGFGIATLFEMSGFSIEVGALFAGVALASSPYSQEIGARLKPLRDFFIVLFFIALGESMNVSNLSAGIMPALVLAAIVMIVKPLVIISAMGLLGYAKRVSFKTGINLSQISEFSIVLIVLATSTGLVGPDVSAVITLVAIITIAISTYLMLYDNQLFAYFDRIKIHMFEKEVNYKEHRSSASYPLVLFGYHHGGHEFIKAFREMGKRYLVVDYDPSIIDLLDDQKIPYIYGDATDSELLDEINLSSTKLVISTFSDYEVTQQLVRNVFRINEAAVIICHANNRDEALVLYELGATYVMIPHHLGSERISSFLRKSGINKEDFAKFRQRHMNDLMASETQ